MKTHNKFKLAIFDMDGLLIDSELHWGKFALLLWKELDVPYSQSLLRDSLGLKTEDMFKMVKSKYYPKLSVVNARRIHGKYKKVVYGKSNLLKGAVKLLKDVSKSGMPVALASSSSFESIDIVLRKHNIKNMFNVIFSTASMRLPGKPSPAVYTKLIKKFKLSPKEVVIFEDSGVGVASAKGSGAKVIAVPDKRWSHGNFSSADLIAKSLADKNVYKFLGL